MQLNKYLDHVKEFQMVITTVEVSASKCISVSYRVNHRSCNKKLGV